jgi:hypothetical protein
LYRARAPTAILLLLALLAGCNDQRKQPYLAELAPAWEPPVFEKPGVAAADRQRDENECVRSAARLDRGDGGARTVFTIDHDAYTRCMKARGYTPHSPREGKAPISR